MNEQQQILLQRLKEAEISLNRFFEVKTDKAPAEGKGYIEHLRTPEEMDKAGIANWGMMGGNFLVPIDIDKQEMYDLLMKVLPPTLRRTKRKKNTPTPLLFSLGKNWKNNTKQSSAYSRGLQ